MTEHGAYAPDLVPEFVIDGHVHIWDLERARYPWLTPEIGELHRSVKFDEIAPTLSRLGIDAAILVQASDEADDTEVMLAAAEGSPSIVGVVAWSPLDTPDEMERTLARFDAIPSVVGIRNLIHERPREWVRRPQVEESLGILAAHRLPLDVPTADHRALPDVAWMGEKAPQLTLVIDHLGKPPINGTAILASPRRRKGVRPLRHDRTNGWVDSRRSSALRGRRTRTIRRRPPVVRRRLAHLYAGWRLRANLDSDQRDAVRSQRRRQARCPERHRHAGIPVATQPHIRTQ